jgi:hypothetical protein
MTWELTNWEDAKNVAETVALILGALFFCYKLLSGYLVTNLLLRYCQLNAWLKWVNRNWIW